MSYVAGLENIKDFWQE